MKQLLLASLITLLAFGTACGQAAEPAPEPVASDGIQVHGDWTVTVTNPDGSVDAVHEFENALYHGDHLIVALLAGEIAVENWQIKLLLYTVGQDGSNFNCEESAIKTANDWKSIPVNYMKYLDASANMPKLLLLGSCTVTDLSPNEFGLLYKLYTYADIGEQDAESFEIVKDGEIEVVNFGENLIPFTHHALADGTVSDPFPKVVNGQTIGMTVSFTFGNT